MLLLAILPHPLPGSFPIARQMVASTTMSSGLKVALSATSGCAGIVVASMGAIVLWMGSCTSDLGGALEHDSDSQQALVDGVETVAGVGVQALGDGGEAIGVGLLMMGGVFAVIAVVALVSLVSRPARPRPRDDYP